MGTDRARNSYDATRAYRSTVSQQGHVDVESDANEAEAIREAEKAAARRSVVFGVMGAVVATAVLVLVWTVVRDDAPGAARRPQTRRDVAATTPTTFEIAALTQASATTPRSTKTAPTTT